jgi:hypothetical protein
MKDISTAVRIAFVTWLFALCNAAYATKPQRPPEPKPPIVIVEKDTNYAAGALIGAGIGYWLHRRAKKHRQPLVLTPQPPVCPTTDERLERVLEQCGK